MNAWVSQLLDATVDADVAADGQARAAAKAAELGMLVVYDDIPEYDKGEPIGVASRDGDQASVAEALGLASI